VKKNGGKFRKETGHVQPERSGGRLAVLGIFRHFLASEMQPAAFLFGSFLFRPCEREMNMSNAARPAVRKRNE
jgi:hypothetical protein